jgi:hypothetical protein
MIAFDTSSWTARDRRQYIATILLALANIPLTASLYAAQWTVRENPHNHYAFWLGVCAASLIGACIIGLSAILGRRTFRFKVGENEMEASGEDADKIMEQAQ